MGGFYQDLRSTYGHPRQQEGRRLKSNVINALRKGLPKGPSELALLGRDLRHQSDGILAFLDVGTSNDPIEAIKDQPKLLRGIHPGFSHPDNYILVVTDPLRASAKPDQRTLSHKDLVHCRVT